MSDRAYVVHVPTKGYLDGIVKDLSRVRQWIEGYESAGKRGPAHAECLRRAQVLLGAAKASGTEARSGETEGLDPQGDGPPEGDAQTPQPNNHEEGNSR